MTINKSQGQTFKAVGIDLTIESFTHGMLYVALSRVGSPNCLTLLVRKSLKTHNVVYKEVLIKCMYYFAALCTVLWVNGKILNVCVII